MEKKKVSTYQKLVFVAYGFFILLGLTWFLTSFLAKGGGFNPTAFFIVVVYGAQVYYRHRFTNLILGILSLAFSIFMLLEVINSFDLMARNAEFDGLTNSLIGLSLLSVVMSVILIFSYTKLTFEQQ
jgi:hypothetical protein